MIAALRTVGIHAHPRTSTLPLMAAVALAVAGPARAFDHDHAAFDEVLQRYVVQGQVAYGELAADRAGLDGYVAALAAVSADELAGFSAAETKALWINAYNALTLTLILDHPGVASIRDIDGAWDKVTFPVAGAPRTLNQIEHEILRKRFPDARLHMVLVCAARSCPPLASRAYQAGRLDAQLEAASRRFVRDARHNRFDAERGVLAASRIFEWYGDDFVARFAASGGGVDAAAGIRGFFATYLEDAAVGASTVTLEWLEYDWRLNGSW